MHTIRGNAVYVYYHNYTQFFINFWSHIWCTWSCVHAVNNAKSIQLLLWLQLQEAFIRFPFLCDHTHHNTVNIEVFGLIVILHCSQTSSDKLHLIHVFMIHFHSVSSLKLYKVQQWSIMYVGIVSYEHHPVLIVPVLNNGGSYRQSLLVCGYTCTLLNTLLQLDNGHVLSVNNIIHWTPLQWNITHGRLGYSAALN